LYLCAAYGWMLTTGTGHSGEVFATRFDPTGQFIASGSMDRNICELRIFAVCKGMHANGG
jgi:WD40 repeat protein